MLTFLHFRTGKDIVLWKDGRGIWRALEDLCSHRYADLLRCNNSNACHGSTCIPASSLLGKQQQHQQSGGMQILHVSNRLTVQHHAFKSS